MQERLFYSIGNVGNHIAQFLILQSRRGIDYTA